MVVKGMVKYANLASCAFLSVICFTRKISQRATKADPLKPHLVAQAILSLRLPKSSSTQSLVLAIGNCPSPPCCRSRASMASWETAFPPLVRPLLRSVIKLESL